MYQMISKLSHKAQQVKELNRLIIIQMLTLATSSFGLVAALAWNEVIKEFVQDYIKPYTPKGSGFLSLLIYAFIITSLAVIVTLQLTKLAQKFSPSCSESSN